jgi:hypothetical protein
MKINELNAPVQPDTYEASMFIKQTIRAGKYAIQIHNLFDNDQEVEAWVQKKIDLATNYISTVGHYLEGQEMTEDAGEGHMAKSQLYSAAKYCMKIATMVRPGDDIEAWVQTKMNKAVDYLDAVYHYEDYQRLNPYREDIGDLHQKHAQIIQKKIEEILATETDIDDIETKPGMFNILKRKVQEVEKKLAKEMREGSRMPSSMIQHKQKLDAMSPDEINHFFQKRAHFFNKPAKELARNQELRFGKKVAAMAPYSRHVQEDILDEGLKDWLQKMAAAGIIIGSLAGVGSINNAIDNSVPVIQAMNTALDQAKNSGNMDLAQEINKDIKGAKLRLDIGKDLNQIAYLQDKYKEYMPAKKEDAVKEYNLSPFKQKVMKKIVQPSKDYREKMATLQSIQNDPNTAKDPEVQKALAKRIDTLKTTGESRTVMYTNKLVDMMGKKLGEGWSEKYKKSINCSNPKGFSQRAHCQGRKK